MRASDTVRADRLTAVVLFAVGVAMLWGGIEMERLEVRRIHPASIPGLVPMLLGGVLALCAVVLFATARSARGEGEGGTTARAGTGAGVAAIEEDARSSPDAGEAPMSAASETERVSKVRLTVAALWSSCYALVLVGRLPFALATTLYVALFVLWFGWPAAEGGAARTRLLVKAAGIGIVAALAIATLFSKGFLVRLP